MQRPDRTQKQKAKVEILHFSPLYRICLHLEILGKSYVTEFVGRMLCDTFVSMFSVFTFLHQVVC